jgi:hypothetical protein
MPAVAVGGEKAALGGRSPIRKVFVVLTLLPLLSITVSVTSKLPVGSAPVLAKEWLAVGVLLKVLVPSPQLH